MSSAAPNLLILFADQLRRSALGVYGDPNVSTPHIDRLAQNGVRFQNACATYPICVPFRFSLMTGEYAHTRFVPAIEWRMSPAERTLADEFNDYGYHTVYCGKWHLYGGHGVLPGGSTRRVNRTPVPRLHQGRWQKWLGFELRNDPYDTCYFEDDDPTPRPLPGYQTDGLFDLTMEYLRNRPSDDRPFCCVLSVEPPHFPLVAPEAYQERWADRPLHLPPNFLHGDEKPTPGPKLTEADRTKALVDLRRYYAMIENLDDNVGRMRAFLEESGLSENTIVVLFSDHGQMDASHSERSNRKDDPYEESVGVPLLVFDPRRPERSGTVLEEPTCTEDLFPTLLGLAGYVPRDPKPGLNLAPLVYGDVAALPRQGVLLEFVHDLRNNPVWGPYHAQYWRAFRGERFKYTVMGDAEGGKPWQFFDLQNDPCELSNLVDRPEEQERISHFHQMLRARLVETGDHYVLHPAYGQPGLNQFS